MVEELSARKAAALGAAPFTYPAVGAAPGPHPGYRDFSRACTLVDRDLAAAGERLLGWEMHERAGLVVHASQPRAAPGVVVEMLLGVGRLGLRVPCRVVHVVDEADRVGFAYGTLPGHPESGEELFLLERTRDGSISFTVSGFTAPATLLARAGGPVSRAVQRLMTTRYLRAIDA